MGLFGGQAKAMHQKGLAKAAQLVGRYRLQGTTTFDLQSIPIEFRGALHLRLENLLWHLENTSERDIGDSQAMREIGDDLACASALCSDKVSEETQRNFRTTCFDAAVELVAETVDQQRRDVKTLALAVLVDMLPSRLESLEIALSWFDGRPTPQSKKYSAAHARTILALGRSTLEARSVKKGELVVSAEGPGSRPCSDCGKANDVDAVFCKSCGRPQRDDTCAGCGLKQDRDAAFCKRCGTPVVRASVGTAEAKEAPIVATTETPAPTSAVPVREQKPVPVDRLVECTHCHARLRAGTRRCPKCFHSL